jgi:(p)ppGpp synthase/HD superfamily hydrolase
MVISETNTNIVHVELKVKDKLSKCKLIIEVKNLSHLTRIIKGITKIKNILNVERVESTTRRRKQIR